MMIITKEFLKEKDACTDGLTRATDNNLIGLEAIPFLNKLIQADQLEWANWLIPRMMERKQSLAYAIFAAEQTLDIYEAKNPDDKRPRLAIDAVKKVLEDDTEENRNAAYAANAAAYEANEAADAADAAANRTEMLTKILNYGIILLGKAE